MSYGTKLILLVIAIFIFDCYIASNIVLRSPRELIWIWKHRHDKNE